MSIRPETLQERAPPNRAERLVSRDALDAFKGVAILLIVLGHNKYIDYAFPFLFYFLYAFHVFLFLLLPSARPQPNLTGQYAGDTIVRYFVPFVAATSFFWCLYALTLARSEPVSARIGWYFAGLIFGTGQTLAKATGFQLCWFLPTLCALLLLKAGAERLGPLARPWVLAGALIVHGLMGLIPSAFAPWFPFGLFGALYTFVLLYAASALVRISNLSEPRLAFGYFLIFAVLSVVAVRAGSTVNLGLATVYGFNRPGLLILNDAIVLSAFMALLTFANLVRLPGAIRYAGRNSLYIYLAHPLVFQAVFQVFHGGPATGRATLIALGVLALFVTLGGAFLFARVVQAVPALRRFVFPKNARDWPPAARWLASTPVL